MKKKTKYTRVQFDFELKKKLNNSQVFKSVKILFFFSLATGTKKKKKTSKTIVNAYTI